MAYERALRWLITHDAKSWRALGSRRVVHPVGEVPQNTKAPYVTFQTTSEIGNTMHQQGRGGLRGDQVEVTCWADDYSEATELRGHVRDATVGTSGTYDGETLQGIFEDNRRNAPEDTADRNEHGLHAAVLVLKIWHEEA